jgi:hypothetical protein
MRSIPAQREHPHITYLRRQSARHTSRVADARRDLAALHHEKAERAAALEEALDEIRPSYHRLRINRRAEIISLLSLGVGEVVVAESVVQALGLTATATNLVAIGVGGAATGLAWLVGHEWAISRDPQALIAGQRGWLRAAVAMALAFLVANLGVRIYYGLLSEEAAHLGSGLVAPLISGMLLTVVTAVLMLVAAFISAHAETGKEAHLRAQLKQVLRELRTLENRVGVLRHGQSRGGPQQIEAQQERPPAA